jgi:serine/threonine protein kinase
MGCSSSSLETPAPVTVTNTPNPLTRSKSIRLDWDSVQLSDFTMGKKLGSGQYADVFQCKHKQNGCEYAMKVMDKSKMSVEEKAGLVQEIEILKESDHPHVMNLYGHFELVTAPHPKPQQPLRQP